MPLVRYALAAAAASCLLGGAAWAQTSAPSDSSAMPPAATDNAPAATDQSMPAQNAPTPADQSAMPSVNQTAPAATTGAGTETSAVVNGQTVEVIASQPVPDTVANRQAFGQPMSRAGKRTAPAGN